MNKLLRQAARFGVVGVVCFFIDYGLMLALTELLEVHYLLSSGLSFTVSVTVNYLLSMRFVFHGKQGRNKITEFALFVVFSVIGLFLTELLMWLMVEKAALWYGISKIAVTGIVMVYNFVTRKLFLEERTSK